MLAAGCLLNGLGGGVVWDGVPREGAGKEGGGVKGPCSHFGACFVPGGGRTRHRGSPSSRGWLEGACFRTAHLHPAVCPHLGPGLGTRALSGSSPSITISWGLDSVPPKLQEEVPPPG